MDSFAAVGPPTVPGTASATPLSLTRERSDASSAPRKFPSAVLKTSPSQTIASKRARAPEDVPEVISGRWVELTTLLDVGQQHYPAPRTGHVVAAVGGVAYLVGGESPPPPGAPPIAPGSEQLMPEYLTDTWAFPFSRLPVGFGLVGAAAAWLAGARDHMSPRERSTTLPSRAGALVDFFSNDDLPSAAQCPATGAAP